MPTIVAALAAFALGVVFRCDDPSGASVPLFTDRPCVGGTALAEVAPNTIAPAPLTSEERALLERIDKARPPRETKRDSGVDEERERRCAAARRGLDALRATRRHGYRASAAAQLDASEARLRTQAEESCGAP